jgi:hypothetical protein
VVFPAARAAGAASGLPAYAVEVATDAESAEPGTHVTLHDDLSAFYDVGGTLTNSADLAARAAARAAEYVQRMSVDPLSRAYSGAHPDLAPAAQLSAAVYEDRGGEDGLGVRTAVTRGPGAFPLDPRTMRGGPADGAAVPLAPDAPAGGTHRPPALDLARLLPLLRPLLCGDEPSFTIARVTGAAVDGLYPAVLTEYDQSTEGWSDGGGVRLLPLNAEPLVAGVRYACTPARGGALGSPVYLAVATCCEGDPPDPAGCYCSSALTFCVTISGVTQGTSYASTPCTLVNRTYTLTYGYMDNNGKCYFLGSYGPGGEAITSVSLEIDAAGNAILNVAVYGAVLDAHAIYTGGTFDCDGGTVFSLSEASVEGCADWPATVTVSLGPCGGTGTGSEPPCDPEAVYCATLTGGAGSFAGVAGSYSLSGDGESFFGGSPGVVGIAVYVYDDGTAMYDVAVPGSAWSPTAAFDCDTGGGVSGGGGDLPDIAVTPGACPS